VDGYAGEAEQKRLQLVNKCPPPDPNSQSIWEEYACAFLTCYFSDADHISVFLPLSLLVELYKSRVADTTEHIVDVVQSLPVSLFLRSSKVQLGVYPAVSLPFLKS